MDPRFKRPFCKKKTDRQIKARDLSMPIQVWRQKIGRVETLHQQLLNGNRGVVSPVKVLWKVHRLSCQVPAVLRERKATAPLELNSLAGTSASFCLCRLWVFCFSSSADIPVQLWVLLQFQWHDAEGKWLQRSIISLNLPSTRVLRGHKS